MIKTIFFISLITQLGGLGFTKRSMDLEAKVIITEVETFVLPRTADSMAENYIATQPPLVLDKDIVISCSGAKTCLVREKEKYPL